MKLITGLLFVLAIFGAQNVKAKSIAADSAEINSKDTSGTRPTYNKRVQQIAVHDTRSFRLTPDQKKELKQGLIPKSSDYFKPTAYYCADPAMLKDSIYVREFREAAYHRAGHRSGGRVIVVAVGVLVVFAALFAIAYATFGAK